MSACSDVPFMLPLSWRPGTRHCICQPDRTRAAPSLKEPFICGERGRVEGGGKGKNRKSERSSGSSRCRKSPNAGLNRDGRSNPLQQQALEKHDRKLLEAILQLDKATGWKGGGCSWRCGGGGDVMVFAQSEANIISAVEAAEHSSLILTAAVGLMLQTAQKES